jgi:hypothetical protein
VGDFWHKGCQYSPQQNPPRHIIESVPKSVLSPKGL